MYSPLGCYCSFETRRRERILAGVVGFALGVGLAAAAFLLGAASR